MSTKNERFALLEELQELCGQGQAENESEDEESFLRNFLPIRSHYRILEPDALIVIGDKGAGKTQVFRALSFKKGRQALTELAEEHGRIVPDLMRTSWLVGFATKDQNFPPELVILDFARKHQLADLQTLWLALLVRVLLSSNQLPQDGLPAELRLRLVSGAWDLEALFACVYVEQGLLFSVLDALDRDLLSRGQYTFIIYDDLDRVSAGDWEALKTILQGLVQFWAAYARRWKRLRPKLFLRRDLYQRAAFFGPDIAKIAAHRVELLWDVREFYGVLFKRLVNSQGHLVNVVGEKTLKWRDGGALGRIPQVASERDYAPAVERLFGKYMGADPRKGMTFNWIPNHLKDGHGRIYPRPLLRLVEAAADKERRDQKAFTTRALVHHTALREALDRVSEFRVLELVEVEFPWLERVQRAFAEKPFLVPAERREVLNALKIDWPEGNRPRSTEPEELLNYLVELGIAQYRRDGRVDVGDLYLRGLHLKRKGGVARPRGVGSNT